MKNFYFKVNRRHIGFIGLIFFVVVSVNVLFVVRVVRAYNPAQEILQLFFPSNDYRNSQGSGGSPTPGANITVTPGVTFPAGFVDVPTGHCQNKLTQALDNLKSVKSQVLPVYIQASIDSATPGPQIPWEIFAAIHYVETGGSFNPNGSLISGRPIGAPEPDQGGVRFTSLLDSAHAAARVFRQKGEYVHYYNRVNNMTPAIGIELIAGQFALYNAITQGECKIEQGINGYNGKYAGGTWSEEIPDNGQCNGGGAPRSHGKGEAFIGDRHVYPSYCKDSAHQTMYFHFHYGGNIIPYTNRVGTLALIWGIQNDPEFRSISSTSPTPTTPTVTGFLRNPTDSQTISAEVIARCQRNYITTNASMTQCMPLMTTVSDRYRSKVTSNNAHTYFQCTQHAVGLANEINGYSPEVHNACAMKTQSSNSPYRFVPKTESPPLPGDLILWDSVDSNGRNICSSAHVGHIAYIATVSNPDSVIVAEANTNYKGQVKYQTRPISRNVVGWLRKK